MYPQSNFMPSIISNLFSIFQSFNVMTPFLPNFLLCIRSNATNFFASICKNHNNFSNFFRVVTSLDCFLSSAITSSTANITTLLISTGLATLLIFSKPSLAIEHAQRVAVVVPFPSLFIYVIGDILNKFSENIFIF